MIQLRGGAPLLLVLPMLFVACLDHHGHQKPWQEPPSDKASEPPPYTVPLRTEILEEGDYYPCDTCHDPDDEMILDKRELEEDHEDRVLNHGGERFWCLSCHDAADRNQLRLIEGETISMDESAKLCGQCHFRNFKDFEFGAHGKRLGNWNGERVLETCAGCHDVHDPSIKPRKAKPPPTMRLDEPRGRQLSEEKDAAPPKEENKKEHAQQEAKEDE